MENAAFEAQAGSLESGDLLVLLRHKGRGGGLSIQLHSPVKAQFGAHVTQVVEAVLAEHNIHDADVLINDRGALDYAIRARVAACAERFRALSSSPAAGSPGSASGSEGPRP